MTERRELTDAEREQLAQLQDKVTAALGHQQRLRDEAKAPALAYHAAVAERDKLLELIAIEKGAGVSSTAAVLAPAVGLGPSSVRRVLARLGACRRNAAAPCSPLTDEQTQQLAAAARKVEQASAAVVAAKAGSAACRRQTELAAAQLRVKQATAARNELVRRLRPELGRGGVTAIADALGLHRVHVHGILSPSEGARPSLRR
jgi:hypothetical protein